VVGAGVTAGAPPVGGVPTLDGGTVGFDPIEESLFPISSHCLLVHLGHEELRFISS
jgi:hypothetical protein